MSELGMVSLKHEVGYDTFEDSLCSKAETMSKSHSSGDVDRLGETIALVDCRMSIAECPVISHSANQFTVTTQGTSVTHRGLADSVLISVSEGLLGQHSGTGQTGARWPNRRHRSFQGGACIQ